jgi:hypothetical protein
MFPGSFFMSLVALFRSCSASRMLLYISEESHTGRPPKARYLVAVEAKTYAYHPALYTSCTVDVANFMSGLQEEVSSLKAIFG